MKTDGKKISEDTTTIIKTIYVTPKSYNFEMDNYSVIDNEIKFYLQHQETYKKKELKDDNTLSPCELTRSYSNYGLSLEEYNPKLQHEECIINKIKRRYTIPSIEILNKVKNKIGEQDPFYQRLVNTCHYIDKHLCPF